MMKILISWLAYQHDFIRDKETNAVINVNPEGPNYNMHRYFYTYQKHILLCSNKGDDAGALMLKYSLTKEFPDHVLEISNMEIKDPIDLAEIKPKIEAKLMELSEHEIDIFVSPGTPAMYVTWYICHSSLALNTRLIQARPAKYSKTKIPELLSIDVEKSSVPVTSVIKESRLDKPDEAPKDVIVTDSIKPVYQKAKLIGETDKVTVHISGETGTGKEHLAKYIHDNSIRKDKPYTTLNCSAFNDQLLESRLFGYKRGSFTGADKDTAGLFEEAEGGTLFLDEIGDISPYMQQSILRTLQEKEIRPIGGKAKKINVRIISATNKDLPTLCKEGTFRWDLYYRLVVAELELPSLQSRGKKEINEMIDYFIKKKMKDLKKANLLNFQNEAQQFLHNYSWPGNVRELENLIETLYIYCDKEVSISDIPSRFRESRIEKSLKWTDFEKSQIEKVLKLKRGNKRQACLALGYKSINTLVKKIKEYDISV
jgi:transcriptional regulator with PAS, ATPase and Fis domain